MTRQIQEAYIVAATRTPVGKAPRGMVSKRQGLCSASSSR
jgi:hypothetical protein